MHRDCLGAETGDDFKGGIDSEDSGVYEGGGAPGIGLTSRGGGGGASS